MSLVPVDTSNAVAVTGYLTQARDWVATCVETTGPEQIASARAEIATAAEATRQLGLSKEIQLDATELVRRFEYALGKALRKGQEDGSIAKRGDIGGDFSTDPFARSSRGDDLVKPSDIVPHAAERSAYYELASVTPEDFEEALADAKDENNPSRRNVVRKIRERREIADADGKSLNRDQRADLIEELAAQGYSSRQMPAKVGVSAERCREIARAYGIEIPADRSVNRTRHIDSTRIVTQAATALEGLVMGFDLIDYASLDPEEVSQWTDSLTASVNALSKAVKKIKESIQ